MKAFIATFVLALLIAACNESSPTADVQQPPPDQRPHDTLMCDIPPAVGYDRSIEGYWQYNEKSVRGTYTMGGNVMLAQTARYGTWNPIFFIRVQRDSGRVWFDAEPMLLPGNACTFSGTMMGDSIVGQIHEYWLDNGIRRHAGYGPAVFYRVE